MPLFHRPVILEERKVGGLPFFVAVPFVALAGFALMYVLVLWSPAGSDLHNGLIVLGIIALGLAIPYWMLKLALHAAHVWDEREKEFHLRDIPKDQQQLSEDEE